MKGKERPQKGGAWGVEEGEDDIFVEEAVSDVDHN